VTRTPPGALTLTTRLRADELLTRLDQAAGDDGDFEPPESDAIRLRVEIAAPRFIMRHTADGPPPHALRRLFDGEVVERPDGTVVTGRFRLHTMTRVALALWFASMSLIVVLIGAGNLAGRMELPAAVSGWVGVGVPLAILAAAAWLVRSSLVQSRRLEEEMERFLTRLVSA
jgi:hypothetical protein